MPLDNCYTDSSAVLRGIERIAGRAIHAYSTTGISIWSSLLTPLAWAMRPTVRGAARRTARPTSLSNGARAPYALGGTREALDGFLRGVDVATSLMIVWSSS